MTKLLIRESDLFKNTPLGANIQPARIYPAIKMAQLTAIKPLLGNDLYNKILDDFVSNTLDGVYKTIFEDYVKQMLIHLSTSYYLTFGAYHITDQGIYKSTGQDNESINKNELEYIVQAQEKYYEYYKNSFYEFMEDVKIPEFSLEQESPSSKIGNWILPSKSKEKSADVKTTVSWSKIKW